MSNSGKIESLKERLKQALTSTAKVISEEFDLKKKDDEKKFETLNLENLNSKNDFIRARADSDSFALKKKFFDDTTYRKNLPSNSSSKSLYSIAEKIRYESLGSRMLKGIKKNLCDNYNQIIELKRKDQLKSKEDVSINEAFELYMIKKFHGIQLNSLTSKMLNFWEKDFDQAIEKHIQYLKENLESQSKYSSKFSEIFKEMEIFQNDENDESREEDKDDSHDNPSGDDNDNNSDDKNDHNDDNKTESSLDADYDIDEYRLDDQSIETSTQQENNKQIIQKKNINDLNANYKIFTNQFDEITKAESLENSDEILKLRKTLDQQLIGFQDIITKLANKLQRQLLAKQNRAWEFET